MFLKFLKIIYLTKYVASTDLKLFEIMLTGKCYP